MTGPRRGYCSVKVVFLTVLLLCLVAGTRAWAPPSSLVTKRPSSCCRTTISTRLRVASESQLEVSDVDVEGVDFGSCPVPGAITENAEETRKLTNNLTLLTNTAVLSTIAVGSMYALTHTHVEALAALWEYDLGETTSPDVTKLAVALEVATRLPLDWIHSYEQLVPQNPIFYKACTSGVAYGLGDFISQIIQGKTVEEFDLLRSARSGAAGFIAHGPLCHFWLLNMERYLDFGGAWWATGIKVTADLTVWSIFLNAAYSFIIGTLAGKSPQEVYKDIRATQWPALRSAWRFWPFVHTVSFSHAVPLDLKLLWVDMMEIVWVTILSKVNNEDKNAQLEQEDLKEKCLEAGAYASDGTAAEGVMDMPVENDPMELPKKAWAAAWPLVAMWPVLYAGFQLEHMLGLIE